MHPAPSVIIFTSLSGLGFGLMFWLGLGYPAVSGPFVVSVFAVMALGLAVIGLLASTFHLGNPQRALRAFTQWRTSWLSREGIVSVLTLFTFFSYACLWAFFDMRIAALGWIAAILALLTVFTTSMIYTQMKTVPRWHTFMTPVLFFLYSLAGGALLAAQMQAAGILLAVLAAAQSIAWAQGDKAFANTGSDVGTATGLSGLGKVRLLEKPHSGTNYLMKEMVHVVGRKHSQKLRLIALLLAALLPALLLLVLNVGHMMAAVVVLMHVVGLFAARWLFFAEAEHVVGLYYDKR